MKIRTLFVSNSSSSSFIISTTPKLLEDIKKLSKDDTIFKPSIITYGSKETILNHYRALLNEFRTEYTELQWEYGPSPQSITWFVTNDGIHKTGLDHLKFIKSQIEDAGNKYKELYELLNTNNATLYALIIINYMDEQTKQLISQNIIKEYQDY